MVDISRSIEKPYSFPSEYPEDEKDYSHCQSMLLLNVPWDKVAGIVSDDIMNPKICLRAMIGED